MRTLSLFLLTVMSLLTVASPSEAVSIRTDTNRVMSHRDSIRQRFLNNGAWHYSISSDEYGRAIDSGLLYSHDDAYLWQQRSMPYFKQMKYEVGMQYLDSAVKYDADKWLDYRAFIKCIFQKSYRAALADFAWARRLHPMATVMDHEYAFYEGLCYLQLDRYDSAEACFARCIADDKALSSGWVHYMHSFYLGVAEYLQGRFTDALMNFDIALETYPRFADAKYYKAMALWKAQHLSMALKVMIEAGNDIDAGFTINEDNAAYERYPYQIRPYTVPLLIKDLREANQSAQVKN